MSTTVGLDIEQTPSIQAINALYLAGFIMDIASAVLAFLTARWLERLTPEERAFLEHTFQRRHASRRASLGTPSRFEWSFSLKRLLYTWMGYSLFSPMPLLVIGVACMVAGLYVYAWTQNHLAVALVVTLTGLSVVPLAVGDFYIGQNEGRRRALIERLSEMQGDW